MADSPTRCADSIVEVTVHYFKKGDRVFFKDVEGLSGLGQGSVEDVSSEIPEAASGPAENLVGQNILDRHPDTVFDRDWTGFEFTSIGEGCDGCPCGLEHILDTVGPDETFQPFREDLLSLAPVYHKFEKVVRFLVAFSYWGYETSDWYSGGTEYEDGIEIIGRLNMSNVNIISPARIAEINRKNKADVKSDPLSADQAVVL